MSKVTPSRINRSSNAPFELVAKFDVSAYLNSNMKHE
jgi:hypothetical protein